MWRPYMFKLIQAFIHKTYVDLPRKVMPKKITDEMVAILFFLIDKQPQDQPLDQPSLQNPCHYFIKSHDRQ